MNNKKVIIISLVFNIVIAVSTIFASVVLFGGFDFMPETPLIESTKLGMFRFFTTDSNIFMGIVSIVFLVYELLLLCGKKKEIPKAIYILKLTATSAVSLTFLVVFCYLGIIVEGGIVVLLKNSSLFFHLTTPVLAIITFVSFERTNKLRFRHALWGILPAVLYAIFYSINSLTHVVDGKVSPEFDFYHLIQGGVWQVSIVVPLLLGVAYGISVALWAANKNRQKNKI